MSKDPNSSKISNPQLGSTERAQASFTLLLFLGAISIGLGIFGIYKSIGSPFIPKSTPVATINSETEDESVSALQQRDTDEDGLSDYDELYRYSTSPYLADSDSDSFSDKEELESGNDPNCPSGQDCTGFSQTESGAEATETSAAETNTSIVNVNSSLPTNESGEVDLAQLREILKSSGAPAYIVDATDDATLIELYETTLIDQQATLEQTDTSFLDSSTLTLESLSDLPASEIRSLLIESGADQSLLSQVSDEDLKSIFQEAVLSETSQ
ncbi:MAG: hypothetical protein V1853_05255 [bacterium]